MTDIAKTFRDSQLQSHAVKEKERSIAQRRQALDELKAQLAATTDEYNRRRTALQASTQHIQPLQADVDAQWAQRNAFVEQQEGRLQEIAGEEQQLADKLSELNHAIVDTVSTIDGLKMDASKLDDTDERIRQLGRALEADTIALGHLQRLVEADDVSVGQRIEAFDEKTKHKYPVDIVDAAMSAMGLGGGGGGNEGAPHEGGVAVNGNAMRFGPTNNNSTNGRRNKAVAAASVPFDDQSMMLMVDANDDYNDGDEAGDEL